MASGDKFCWSCGSSLFRNDKFCRECGVDLEQRQPVTEETQGKPTPPKEQKPRTSKTAPGVVADVPKVSIDFLGAIKLGFQHYADFDGRASRPEFWWWFLFTTLGSGAIGLIEGFFYVYSRSYPLGIILFIFCLLIFLPTLAVTARRLRDVNRSPWWVLGSFIPIVSIMVMIYCIDGTYVPSQTFRSKQAIGKSLGKSPKIPPSFEQETQTLIKQAYADTHTAREQKEEE